MGASPADRIRGGVILAYFALVNNTASLWSVPRARAMCFPSTDQPKSQITPEAKWVNCFVGPPNHAIRWEFTDRNPISGPNKGAGVRQSSKRQSVPDILEVSEIQAIVAELQLRERVLLFLDMATGLRRGELAGVRWQDFDFAVLDIDVQRSVVDQVVGRCKTEASQKRIPLDGYTAQDLLAWFQQTLYRDPDDYVFAANSSRAGKKRGKQPLWLSTIMRYYIQPVVKRLGIKKRVTWHTFRRTYTTLLHANGEDVKVVQELLRHSSSRITMDIYAQAQMPAKRAAQQKVVEMVRSEKTAPEAKKMA